MKTLRYICILGVCAALHGCYSLDTAPPDKVALGNFWQTEADATDGVMSVYAQMKDMGAFGYQVLFDTYTDLAQGGASVAEKGTLTGRYDFLVTNWKDSWEGIQRANHVLRFAGAMSDEQIDPLTRQRILGEAYFLRALFYFRLTDLWGALPIYDQTREVTEYFSKMYDPRAPQSQVWDFIVSSLDKAVDALPVAWPAEQTGRATKGAAYALRGKANLYRGNYPAAIADFEEIVYNKTYNYGYALMPNLMTLFLTAGPIPGDKETIFAIQCEGSAGNTLGTEVGMLFGNRGTYTGGRATCTPSTDLADMFDYKDGKPFSWTAIYPGWDTYDPATGTYPTRDLVLRGKIAGGVLTQIPDTTALGLLYRSRDPRLYQSLIVPWSKYDGWSGSAAKTLLLAIADGGELASGFIPQDRGVWSYYYRKFAHTGNLGGKITDRRQSPINVPLIRLADVLLMLSEAYNENDQLDKAVVEFNKVRARPSTNMPRLNNGEGWMAVPDKQTMHDWIMKERALELHGEGHRYSDIRRWRTAKGLLNNKEVRMVDGKLNYTRIFDDRNYLWPLPTEDVINCPNLLPDNPGW